MRTRDVRWGTRIALVGAVAGSVDLQQLLREQFGHPHFRDAQERVIRALLDGRDALTILPTGGGKSLIYQLAAQLLPGLTVVISPLLALMKDQVESLESRGVHVSLLNSEQSDAASEQALIDIRAGRTKLLYVTPERFDDPDFVGFIERTPVSLFVVDEAHSISEWGHTFRPAYLGLRVAIERLKRPTVLALTATATPWVRQDMVERLDMRHPLVVVRGTDRPNLFLEVIRVEQESEDRRILRELFEGDSPLEGSGILYVGTTKAAQETAGWLTEWGISADFYHGQRRKSDRQQVQDAFMSGEIRVIAATNAFGLGIDKPDVRFVVHRDIPSSLEAYYQEAGRAGRDGESARCTLIYRPGDLGRAAFLAAGGELTRDEVIQAHHGLRKLNGESVSTAQLQSLTGLGRTDVARFVQILTDRGLAEQRRGQVRLKVADFDPEALPLEQEQRRRAYERSRLEMMRGYAELRECRRRYILNYFGEEPDWTHCDRCDVDASRAVGEEPGAAIDAPFASGEAVLHPSMGRGVIQRVTRDAITVLFNDAGYKTLDLQLILERQLLQKTFDA